MGSLNHSLHMASTLKVLPEGQPILAIIKVIKPDISIQ